MNSKQFSGSNTLPQGHYYSKENKFPTLLTKTRGQMCFIERRNTPTFWESRICLFQQLSLKCPSKMPASRRNVFHPHSSTNLQLLNKQIYNVLAFKLGQTVCINQAVIRNKILTSPKKKCKWMDANREDKTAILPTYIKNTHRSLWEQGPPSLVTYPPGSSCSNSG